MNDAPESAANEHVVENESGGAVADALTLLRILVTPVIVFLIISGWPGTAMAAIASMLFAVAALTDIFDDMFGGTERAPERAFGYLDDIADTVLIVGTLGALLFVLNREGIMAWPFAVPAIIIIAREILIGLFKGFELQRYGWPDNPLSNAKAGFTMLGTCILVASPWLTQFKDSVVANDANIMDVYNAASPMIWVVGQIALWIGAIFAVLSAIKIFRADLSDDDTVGTNG